MAQPRTVLCFDFGSRRIGVAVGQDVTGSASPLGVIVNRADGIDYAHIERLIAEWRPTGLVVGMPVHLDGSVTELQPAIDAFIAALTRYELPIATVDERYTSVEAERILKEARAAGRSRRISREMIDSTAAVLIAERFLAKPRSSGQP